MVGEKENDVAALLADMSPAEIRIMLESYHAKKAADEAAAAFPGAVNASPMPVPAATFLPPPAQAATVPAPQAAQRPATQAANLPHALSAGGVAQNRLKNSNRPKAQASIADLWANKDFSLKDMASRPKSRQGSVPAPGQARHGTPLMPTATPSTNAGATAAAAQAQAPKTASTAAKGAAAAGSDEHVDEEEIDVEDELEDLQRYAVYQSSLPYGLDHPDPLVEAASLASCPPPPITYVPKLYSDEKVRAKLVETGALSKIQLESVVYASQKHLQMCPDNKSRAGFAVGDGAGVGKGRTIAGIIYENHLHGRKRALWVSVSADLYQDARRDLSDIGANHISVTNIAKLSYERLGNWNGVLFSTYSSLIAKRQARTQSKKGKGKMMDSRLEQVIEWLGGEDFDGLLIFDESHKAKNLVPPGKKHAAVSKDDEGVDLPEGVDVVQQLIDEAGRGKGQAAKKNTKTGATQTGIVIAAIQERLKKARVVYVSATGVSETRNLAYMSRLGLWGPGTSFPTGFKEFYENVEKRGSGAMECLALDLKSTGSYLARTLSYATASFEVINIPHDPSVLDYDASVDLWLDLKDVLFKWASANTTGLDGKALSVMTRLFWGSHQRFFRYLVISSKVPAVIEISKKALEDGKAVVIGLQNTGEANTAKRLAEEPDLEGLVSSPKESIIRLLIWFFRKCFVPDKEVGSSDDDLDLDGYPDDEDSDGDGSDGSEGDDSYDSDSGSAASSRAKRPARKLRRRPVASIKTENDSEDSGDESGTSGSSDFEDEAESMSGDDRSASSASTRRPSSRSSGGRIKSEKADKVKKEVKDEKVNFDSDSDVILIPDSDEEDYRPRPSRAQKSKMASSSSDSETGEDEQPRRKPKDVKMEVVKQEPSDAKRKLASDSESSDAPIWHPRKRVAALESEDDSDVSAPRPAKPPQKRRVNLDRQLKPLYKALGSKQALEQLPFFESLCDLLEKTDKINLPDNALDQLVIELGGPAEVAELTGRKMRAIKNSRGRIVYEKRYGKDKGVTLDNMNLAEKAAFMAGKKDIAIISDAASAGISLQADRRVKNQKRRVHITLELAWAADKTVVQLGRTHRSNQSSAPEYILVISQIAGENRFASAVAKRLSSMGALTKGDRKASNGISLNSFHFDTKFGRLALERAYSAIVGNSFRSNFDTGGERLTPEVLPEGVTEDQFFERLALLCERLDMVGKEADVKNIPKFLNRLLGLPLKFQNPLFEFFAQNLRHVLIWAKRNNKYDRGVETIGGLHETLAMAEGKDIVTIYRDPRHGLETRYFELVSDRGMSFAAAKSILDDLPEPDNADGFYISTHNGHEMYQLAVAAHNRMFKIYKPNVGEIFTLMSAGDLRRNYRKVRPEEIQARWTKRYEFALKNCTHKLGKDSCAMQKANGYCDFGLRLRSHHLIVGNIMAIWRTVESAMVLSSKLRLKIVRTAGTDDEKLKAIGLCIPSNAIADVLAALRKLSAFDKMDFSEDEE